jgi:aspartate/methionine/tyrosine aminotransferase
MENIYLLNGASEGITILLRMLIQNEKDGIMIPTPQYPIYSALITLNRGQHVPYYLEESNGWGMSLEELERSYKEATDKGIRVKAMVVINPGNPTGQVLDEEGLKRVIEFTHDKKIMLLADEVYQKNIYVDKKFVSLRKTLNKMGEPYSNNLEIASYHSISKGLLGE